MKPQHLLLAVLITAIWGVNFSVIKIGLLTTDPFILAALRFLLCAVPAVFFIPRPDTGWRYIIGYGLMFGVGVWGVANLAIQVGISAGMASLVLQFSALFTILAGGLLLREQINRYQLAGIAIALSGLVSIMLVTDGSVSITGLALVLLSALAWSVANIISKKAQAKRVFAFIVWSSLFAPLPLLLLDFAVKGTAGYASFYHHADLSLLLSVLFQVYPNTLFAWWIWNSLIKKYPLSTVAPVSLLVPLFGLLGSAVIFDEAIGGYKIAACVMIMAGLITGLYGKRLAAGKVTPPREVM